MELFEYVRNLIVVTWWFFAQYFWAGIETLWKSESRGSKFWYVRWLINAAIAYSAILVTKGFAGQIWFGFKPLALLVAINVAAGICVVAFIAKQQKFIALIGQWAWVVWTSSMLVFVFYVASSIIK